jgi:hypothetical protein
MHVFAVIFMVKGLEYHYENFQKLVKNVTFPSSGLRSEADTSSIERAKLEAIAYINTIGQLYYWADRYFFPNRTLTMSRAPTIVRVTESFRHKYSAHLSIDKHHREDSEQARALHLFAFIGGILWDRDGNIILQIQKVVGEWIELNLINEHENILKEVQEIFYDFISNKSYKPDVKSV